MADANNQSGDAYHVDGVSNNESNTDVVAIHDDTVLTANAADGDPSTTNELIVTGTAIAIVENTCDGNIVCGRTATGGCCDGNVCPLDGNTVCTKDSACCEIVAASSVRSSESSTADIVELVQPLFEKLVVEVKQRMAGSSISSTTVTIILKYAMEVVELSEVKGAEQKELALGIVRQIIVDAPLSETAESACMLIIDSGILMGVVDLVVDATKGRLSVNQVKKRGRSCLRGLGCMKA